MNAQTRRAWYQIQASTALVLMLVAGVLICVNSIGTDAERRTVNTETGEMWLIGNTDFGWPFRSFMKTNSSRSITHPHQAPSLINGQASYGGAAILNVIIAIMILVAVWYVCERLLQTGKTRR